MRPVFEEWVSLTPRPLRTIHVVAAVSMRPASTSTHEAPHRAMKWLRDLRDAAWANASALPKLVAAEFGTLTDAAQIDMLNERIRPYLSMVKMAVLVGP